MCKKKKKKNRNDNQERQVTVSTNTDSKEEASLTDIKYFFRVHRTGMVAHETPRNCDVQGTMGMDNIYLTTYIHTRVYTKIPRPTMWVVKICCVGAHISSELHVAHHEKDVVRHVSPSPSPRRRFLLIFDRRKNVLPLFRQFSPKFFVSFPALFAAAVFICWSPPSEASEANIRRSDIRDSRFRFTI